MENLSLNIKQLTYIIMKTIELKLYSFNELSETAKQKAISQWSENFEDIWQNEREESYKKAKEIFDQLENIQGEIYGSRLVAYIHNNFSYLWIDKNRISKHTDGKIKNCYYSHKYNCTKFRISKIFKTNNLENCPLTGVCYDFDFLQPIIDFLKNPSEKVSNLDLCIPSYESIAYRDYIYQTSDEYIIETIEANEYTFLESGKLFNA